MRRHWGWRGLLVGKRVQEVREKKRKKGKIIIVGKMITLYRKLGGKIYMKKKEEINKKTKNKKNNHNVGVSNVSACMGV